MLNGSKILVLLYTKHEEEFGYLVSHISDKSMTLSNLIEESEGLLINCIDGSSAWHIKHFCLPLLKEIAFDYYASPNEYINLEIN